MSDMIQSTEVGETRKKCKETVLAESVDIIYKIMTFLLIKNPSSVAPEATSLNRIAFKVLSYFAHIFLALNSGRFLLLLINNDVRKKENILLVLVLAFSFSQVAFSILYRLLCKDTFTQLRDRLLELELYLEDEKLIHLTRKLKISLITLLVSSPIFSLLILSLFILVPDENSVMRIYFTYPIPIEGGANLTVSMFSIIFHAVEYLWPQVIITIAIWLMIFLRNEFNCVAESFRRYFPRVDTKKANLNVTERNSCIFQICEAHDNLCRILESTDCLCRFYLGFAVAANIAQICLLTFGIIHRSVGNFQMVYILLTVIFTVPGAFVYLKEGIALNLSVHKLTDDFYAIDLRHLSTEASSKVSIFLIRLTSSPIGLTLAGLFVINRSTILTLIGTLLTYIIVVLQTKAPDEPNNNITATGI